MSVIIIGGDKIDGIISRLYELGVTKAKHWDSRKNSTSHKQLPAGTDAVILLTDYLKHNSMFYFKKAAKKKNIPYICSRRGIASVETKFNEFLTSKA